MKDAVFPASKHEGKRHPSGAEVHPLAQPEIPDEVWAPRSLSVLVRDFGGGRIGVGQSLGVKGLSGAAATAITRHILYRIPALTVSCVCGFYAKALKFMKERREVTFVLVLLALVKAHHKALLF